MAGTYGTLISLDSLDAVFGWDTGAGGGTALKQVLTELAGFKTFATLAAGSLATCTITGIDTVDHIVGAYSMLTTGGSSVTVTDQKANVEILATNLVRQRAAMSNQSLVVMWFDKTA